jgi:hypothetical protein
MHASIRKYYINPGTGKEFLQSVQEGFVPIISQVTGFAAYYVLEVGENQVITISLFDSQAGAEASVQQAADWVARHLVPFLQRPPEITAIGQVRISQLSNWYVEFMRELMRGI